MHSEEIRKINEANFVLRHFVNLSARLLPFLEELQQKENPSQQEIINKEKIIDVFKNYSFDTHTSELLINSNILELIKKSFDHLSRSGAKRRAGQKNRQMSNFLNEYQRLRETWYQTLSN